MTPADLAQHIAALDKLSCGCTVDHVGLCPVALALWEVVKKRWKTYHSGIGRDSYFAATRAYLGHFGNSHAPEPVAEAERARQGTGL